MAVKIEKGTPLGLALEQLLDGYMTGVNDFVETDFDRFQAGDRGDDGLLSFLGDELVERASERAFEVNNPEAVDDAHKGLLEMIDTVMNDLQNLRERCANPTKAMERLRHSMITAVAVEQAVGDGAGVSRLRKKPGPSPM